MKIRIIIAGILLTTLCTSCAMVPESPTTPNKQVSTPEDSMPETSVPMDTTTATTESTPNTINVGDTFTLDDFEIVVTSLDFADRLETSYNTYFEPDEGNIYAVISLTITNNGKEADTFLPTFSIGNDIRARILFGDGYEFSPINLLGYENDLHDSSLNPLSSKSGQIVFEVVNTIPENSDPLVLELDGKGIVTVNLR